MKRSTSLLGTAVVLSTGLLALGAASSGNAGLQGRTYAVTVTNLTAGQVFSPLLLATHTDDVALFEPGAPASAELALLAEEGDGSQLASLLLATKGVADVAGGTGMIPPGASETVEVGVKGNARRLSLATMLVSTNDTFAALRGVELPVGKHAAVVYARAWDAGSERNSESCLWVPGPPCGAGGMHDPAPAEGHVHVSPGIHGVGDLDPATRDWRNPVAVVTVRRAD